METSLPIEGAEVTKQNTANRFGFFIYYLKNRVKNPSRTVPMVVGRETVSYTHLTLPTIYSV